jgi:hypothetical protein
MTGWRRGSLCALVGLSLWGCLPGAVTAPPRDTAPTYLWGIRKSCRRDAYLSSAVEKRLLQMSGATGGEVRRLLPGPTIENAAPRLGAAELRRSCRFDRTTGPQSGYLLGGRVEDRGGPSPYTLMRLFRVDLATQEIAYRDHYCRGCDIARTLSTQAAFLLEAPGPPLPIADPPALPSFCVASDRSKLGLPGAGIAAPPPRPPLAVNPDADRVSLVLRSAERKPRSTGTTPVKLLEGLRQHLSLTGREVVPTAARYTLTVELLPDGGAQLLLASRGGRGQQLSVEKPRAGAGAVAEGLSESMVDRVVRAAGRLLDEAAATDAELAGQSSLPLYELPLPAPAYAALCQASPSPDCKNASSQLDSDVSFSQFFDPVCGEPLEDSALGGR